MKYTYEEMKDIACNYMRYCTSVREKIGQIPFDFDEWYEKSRSYSELKVSITEHQIDDIIKFLNRTCECFGKRGFKIWGKKIRSLIRTKLKEGFTPEDFEKVIKVKTAWLNDKSMHKYYRPITLFGGKFEDYLNESSEPIQENNQDEFTEAINRAATDTY